MLSRDGSLSSSVTWKHVKSHFRGDPAYSAVEKSSQREELYLQYLETLDLERVCVCVCVCACVCVCIRACVHVRTRVYTAPYA